MYELLWVGLYGHRPWPSNSSINSNSPDDNFSDADDKESLSVDEAAAAAPSAAITLSLVVDCVSSSNVSSSCDDELSALLGPFLYRRHNGLYEFVPHTIILLSSVRANTRI